jgi:hypothetical protein
VPKKVSERTRAKATAPRRHRRKPAITAEEEQILRAATIHLIRKVGGLLVATGFRAEHHQGSRRWIITVTLRYPTGHEGYVGDLLYNGKEFRLLTEPALVNELVRQIAADPEGVREWNEYRASPLRPGKA